MTTPEKPSFTRAEIEAIENPVARLRVIMQRLLAPDGCPWDREQDHMSLRKYIIEEAHEAVEAIEEGDDAEFCEELGDLALQVVFHAELAERRGAFKFEDIYAAICRKLIERHPHVFGEVEVNGSGEVLQNWEQIKKGEKKRKAEARGDADNPERTSALAGVPKGLPGLHRATRLQEKASRVGFDWDKPADVAAKVREEVEEFLAEANADGGTPADSSRIEEEFGDLLFSLVNLSRFMGFHAEEAMRRANEKFSARFIGVESLADAEGKHLGDMTLDELDALWERIKKEQNK